MSSSRALAAAPPGPIALKVLAALNKWQRRQVIDLAAWRAGKARAEQNLSTVISAPELSHLDPSHGVYVYAQNQLAVLIDQLAELPMVAKLTNAYADADDKYMPSGPPISPLTKSYFTSWGAFDLSVGVKQESFTTIAIAVGRRLGMVPELLRLFEILAQSRLGIYRHEGRDGPQVILTELITEQRCSALVPSGYQGRVGELWLARVLPPAPMLPKASAVVFTTPYLLGQLDDHGHYALAQQPDWWAYFERALPHLKSRESAYERLMKRGLSRHYWNEYITEAYVNHREDAIYLAGLPDRPRSLPHSKAGQERWGN